MLLTIESRECIKLFTNDWVRGFENYPQTLFPSALLNYSKLKLHYTINLVFLLDLTHKINIVTWNTIILTTSETDDL